MGGAGHGIRLWFALAGVMVDCRFLRPRRAIEVIEMLEVIEVIWDSAGWCCVFLGGFRGGRVGDILNLGPLDSGWGMDFPYGLRCSGKSEVHVFRTCPTL